MSNDHRLSAIIWLLPCLPIIGCIDRSADPALYRAMLNRPAVSTQPSLGANDALSLIHALELANADNESIASRGEDYIQALADKMRQAGTFLPTISLGPIYNLTHISSGSVFVPSGSGSSVEIGGQGSVQHQLTVPVNASISGSMANASNLQAASLTIEQRAQLLLDERETILLDVVQSYYSALKAERQAALYESTVGLKAEKVRDQETRLRLGAVRPLDEAQSQADLASVRVSLTQARTDAANARSALARLMGVTTVAGPLTDAFDIPTVIQPLETWQEDAQAQRPDLVAAHKAREASAAKVEAAIREYFPTASINFGYLLYNDPKSSQLWNSAISASFPIFSAMAIEADIRSAWSLYRQAGLTESQIRRQVIDDINQGCANFQGSRRKIADLEIQVAAAQKAYDLAERAYQLGSESNLDRLTQQDNLLLAQLNLLSERFNEKSNYLALLRAAGKLGGLMGK